MQIKDQSQTQAAEAQLNHISTRVVVKNDVGTPSNYSKNQWIESHRHVLHLDASA